jgi:hypothetical protein
VLWRGDLVLRLNASTAVSQATLREAVLAAHPASDQELDRILPADPARQPGGRRLFCHQLGLPCPSGT